MAVWQDNLRESYREAFGRDPRPDEWEYWGARADEVAHTWNETLVSWHMTWLVSPAGAAELDAMIRRSYEEMFGREPTHAELTYWRSDVRKRKHTYVDLIRYHQRWNAAPAVVDETYKVVFGRGPTPTELNYWLDPSRRENVGGTPAATVEDWHMTWLLSPSGKSELPAMITRSYQTVFHRVPTANELSFWESDVRAKRHTYRDLVAYHQQWLKHPAGDGHAGNGQAGRSHMNLRVSAPDPGLGITEITSASFAISGPSTLPRTVPASRVGANKKLWQASVPFPRAMLGDWQVVCHVGFNKDDHDGVGPGQFDQPFTLEWTLGDIVNWGFCIHYHGSNPGRGPTYTLDQC